MTKLSKIAFGLAAVFAVALSAEAKVTVFAAASMTDALKQVAADYKKVNPSEEVTFSFAASGDLAKQIEQGAPADIFISANGKWMKYLSDKNLTVKDTEKLLVGNKLVLVANKDSKIDSVDVVKGDWIKQLKDSYLAIGEPKSVPAGEYAKEALTKLNLWDKLEGKYAKAQNVRAALALVEVGEAPLGIVYGSDALKSKKVKTVGEFPASSYTPVDYPIALIKDHKNAETEAFLKYLESDAAKKVYEQYGFAAK